MNRNYRNTSIDLKYDILDDISPEAMENAIVKMYPSDIDLNEVGNVVLIGHNYNNGTLFSHNEDLENGDEIIITDKDGDQVTYEVYNKFVTTPSDVNYMVRSTNGKREISLSSCTDDTQNRIIILAREK